MSVGVRVAEGWCHAVKFVVGRIWDEADVAAVCMDRWRKSEEDGAWRFPSVVLVTLLLLANEYNIYYLVFTRRAGISNVGFVCFFHSSATTKDSQSHVYHRTPCCSVLATIFPFCLFCFLFFFCSVDFDNKIFAAAARYFCREHCSMLTLYFRTYCSMLDAACVSWCLSFVVIFFIKLDNQSFAVAERYY